MVKNLQVAQDGVYVEVITKVLRVAQAGAYLEVSTKILKVVQIGIYVEVLEPLETEKYGPRVQVI